jgi:allophanate hydrolase
MSVLQNLSMSLSSLRAGYLQKQLSLRDVVDTVISRCEAHADNPVWIHRLTREQLEPYVAQLEQRDPASLPLYGVPFAIKDNIDLANVPTTAACREFAFTPEKSAFVVQLLIDAGAIPIGKTNLDQFATGLNGTRSPYGAPRNSFNPEYISGGSSSGSSVAVALGQVSFSLGTDTAGSGRVPAAFNNLIGVKPSRGLLSVSGVLPAGHSIDCVTLFCLNCNDAETLLALTARFDAADEYSRAAALTMSAATQRKLKIGIAGNEQLAFFGDSGYATAYEQFIAGLRKQDVELVNVDISPLLECARLLYEGPYVAERYAAIEAFVKESAELMNPVVRAIIEPATKFDAISTFKAEYRRQQLLQQSRPLFADVDCLLLPTAGALFTLQQLQEEPIKRNSELGYYTNFMNLLDLASIAIPAGFTSAKLPFGVTLIGNTFSDFELLAIGHRLLSSTPITEGATGQSWKPAPLVHSGSGYVPIAVCGAHLSGMALNHQLLSRNARLLQETRSAPHYRLYALAGGPPFRPGMIRVAENGAAIIVEVWEVPTESVGSFLAGIGQPLGLGKIELENGQWVTAFICEGHAVSTATDITHFGGWRAYMASRA